jgi:hypothetical protein
MRTSLRKHLSIFVQRRLMNERRGGKRIVPVHHTLCLIPSSGDERTTTLVQDISPTGVAMQTEHLYAPGALLRVLLVNEAHTFSLMADVSVVRSVRMGDHYVTAGHFVRPLTHEEIVPFIQ